MCGGGVYKIRAVSSTHSPAKGDPSPETSHLSQDMHTSAPESCKREPSVAMLVPDKQPKPLRDACT